MTPKKHAKAITNPSLTMTVPEIIEGEHTANTEPPESEETSLIKPIEYSIEISSDALDEILAPENTSTVLNGTNGFSIINGYKWFNHIETRKRIENPSFLTKFFIF